MISATLPAFLLLLGLSFGLQYASGAYSSAFSSYPDEPAHYVTGLMVRDYLAHGMAGPPLAYAQDYYLHYPEVALGQWPPVFYMIQAAWTLVFSPGRASVLFLMAILTTVLALSVFAVAREEWGTSFALVGGLLFVALPLVQTSASRIMTEIPVALFGFLAILALGRYMERERWMDAAAFGLLASVAIMTKGSGFALGLAPLLAALLARRLALLRRPSFWLPALIVGVACGPWYVLTAGGVVDTFVYAGGTAYTAHALRVFSSHFINVLGLLLFPLVCLGAITRLRPGPDGTVSGRWAAIAALPLSVLIFHISVSVTDEDRHVVTATPALILLFLAGVSSLATRLPPRNWPERSKRWLLIPLCVIVFLVTVFDIPQKRISGYSEAAQAVLATADFRHSILMVSTHAVHGNGEGMLIAEIAMREQRPGHYIIRATKALSRIDWNATEQQPLYESPEEVLAFLDSVPVGGLVLDMTPRLNGFQHHDLLVGTVQAHPERFILLSVHPLTRAQSQVAGSELRVYRVVGNENPAPERIHMDRGRLLPPRASPW